MLLLIVRQAVELLRPLFAGLHLLVSYRCGIGNHHRGYHPSVILHDLFLYRDLTRLTLQLNPLEIPPANLLKIGRAIGTSNHTAELTKKHHGTVHGLPEVMKDQVLMNPAV